MGLLARLRRRGSAPAAAEIEGHTPTRVAPVSHGVDTSEPSVWWVAQCGCGFTLRTVGNRAAHEALDDHLAPFRPA